MKRALILTGAMLGCLKAELSLETADAMTRVSRAAAFRPEAPLDLRAARGEWEAFQAILGGSPQEVADISVEASPLTGPDNATLPAPVVWREHYVKVSRSTPMSSLPAGDYPDALVPQSFTWQKLPNQRHVNQPFWVDIFVPYTAKAGEFSGTLTVKRGAQTLLTHTYSLHVWDFDLPVVPRLRTSVMTVWRRIAEVHGFDPRQEPPAPALAKLLDQYYDLLAQHRLSIDQTYPTYPDGKTGALDESAVEAGMRKQLLHRHASTLGLPLWPEWPFGDPLGKDREAALKYVATWMKLLTKIRAESRGYVIMGDLDEPNNAEAYANIRRWGDFFNEVEARHKVRAPLLVTEQPTPDDGWWGRLDESVDIWTPHFSQVWEDMESPKGSRDIARRISAGDEVWTYAALVQMPEAWEKLHDKPTKLTSGHPPVWALDYPAMNHRVITWLLPRHGITGLAYWDTLFASPGIDVWANAGTFQHPSGDVYNGDGSYIYPATGKRHGVDAPLPSIRLKWLREAAEDYDYLMLARDLGLEKEARALIDTFARGFGDWEDDMPKLYEARRKLGDLIADKGGRP